MFLMSVALASAQSITVTGIVVDGNSQPLPGVNVLEKNTSNGMQTDFDGKYSVTVSSSDAILVFSYIGFVTQEIKVGSKTNINVSMQDDVTSLDEIVLVGYGSQDKQAVTGAVVQADLETYSRVPVNNIMETVKGTVPGLNVGAINQAGQVAGFSIRGTNSIGASNNPLIVVDGVIYNGSLASIPNNDIESFTVLKDASAAAVYGSRSGNGVILIQTKRGKGTEGRPKISLNINTGITTQFRVAESFSGEAYLQNVLDIRESFGQDISLPVVNYLELIEQENYNATPDNRPTLLNPYDAVIQNAFNNQIGLSISNSSEKSNYFISMNVTDQKGVIKNDNFKLFSGRINISSEVTDWLKLGVNSFYALRDLSGASPNVGTVPSLSPYASLFDENGNYTQFPQTTTSVPSPFWDAASEDIQLGNDLNANVNVEIKVPGVKGLTFRSTLSNNLRRNEGRQFFDIETTRPGQENSGIGSRNFSKVHYQLFDNIINYKRTFAEKHKIDLTLLYSREKRVTDFQSLSGRGFDDASLRSYGLANAAIQNVDTGGELYTGLGKMARLTYGFDNRYTVTGTVRRDGASAFSKNKKWGTFSSLGFNWNITNEKFLQDSNTFNELTLSASYGSVGNQAISPYQTLARIGNGKVIFSDSNNYVITQSISSFALNDLGWETTTGLNLGLNFGLFGNTVSGRIDAYQTTTNNLLFNLRVPRISGGPSTILSNVGELANEGIELTLNTLNINKEDFKWRSSLNFSLNRNEVVSIIGDDNDGDGVEDDLINSNLFIGKPLGTIYSYKVIGMWQQEDVDNGTIMTGMRPGDYKLEDVDGDGRITSDKDRQFLGTSAPNFTWSLTNTIDYKKWSLMAYIYSICGGNDQFLSGGNTPYNDFGAYRTDVNHPVYDYWTPTNTNALFPRPDYSRNAAFRGVKYFDRSFIKLQKISLAYDFTEIVKPMGINNLTLAISADNLAAYDKEWVGLDAETGNGVTAGSRPSLRTYLLSLNINL